MKATVEIELPDNFHRGDCYFCPHLCDLVKDDRGEEKCPLIIKEVFDESNIEEKDNTQKEEKELKTKGDVIRESNESLAEFIDHIAQQCADADCDNCKIGVGSCNKKDINDYLNQPSESEE